MKRETLVQIALVTMLTLLLSVFKLTAQETPIIIVSMPLLSQEIPSDTITRFEADYGVRVQVKADPTVHYLPDVIADPQAYINRLREYAQDADVIYVDRYTLNGIGAQTGFLLDMSPFIAGDATLNPADFHAAAWEAFQWDGQMLALPTTFNSLVLGYNADAFDAVALSYPTGNWTIHEFATVARALTERDANGTVIRAGYESSVFDMYLIQAMLNQSLLDNSQFPAQLNTNDSQFIEILTVWQQLRAEGVIGQGDNMANTVGTMTILPSRFFENSTASATLLPNNRAGIDVGGYAISAGTANPQLAYALVRKLTDSTELVANVRNTYSAKLSIPMQHAVSQQVNGVLEIALSEIMPYGDLRYGDYLRSVLGSDNPVVHLQEIQATLNSAIQLAQETRDSTTIVVETPAVRGDGVVLSFGVSSNILPLPNQEQWTLAVEEFVTNNPDVGWIEVEGSMVMPDQYAETYDCFAISQSWIGSFDPATLMRLDPMIMQDVSFNADDFVPIVWDTVNRNGEVISYPLTMTPYYMAVDTTALGNQGITIDENWTIDQFIDSAIQWHSNTGTSLYELGDSHDVLTLLASYGAIPIDTRTTPPSATFTASETVNALQQILGLARDGQLGYASMTALQGVGGTASTTPIQSLRMTATGYGVAPIANATQLPYPQGNETTVTSHSLISGVISGQTQYADACYQWLKFVSEQSYIYDSMPVMTELVTQSQSPFMMTYLHVLQQATLINVPYIQRVGSTDTFVLSYLLNQAMDAHVLDNQDLVQALQLAQENADLYLGCRSSGDTVQNCAVSIVPEIENVLR